MNPANISKKDLIIGIDVLKQSVIISFLSENMNDPGTVMAENGENARLIPLVIAKERELGRWYVGDEAIQKARIEGATQVEDLYGMAYRGESIEIESRLYSYEELFATYLRRVVDETGFSVNECKKLVITTPEVDERAVELFSSLTGHLSISRDILTLVDHRESFIYYTLSQNSSIHMADVALFDCEGEKVYSCVLHKDTRTRPQVVDLTSDMAILRTEDRDRSFCDFIDRVFSTRIISSVFLMGEGFDGGWMQESVDKLCRDRRVFLGDNLYSKGACFAGRIRLGKRTWPFIHMGDHEMKMNVSLKVSRENDMSFVTLVNAGQNWYEAGRDCEVILDGSPEFECWIQSPETRKARITMIELKEMPKRANRTTRLRISASPVSNTRIKLIVRDLGFGDIAPSSGRMWEHLIDLSEGEGWEN